LGSLYLEGAGQKGFPGGKKDSVRKERRFLSQEGTSLHPGRTERVRKGGLSGLEKEYKRLDHFLKTSSSLSYQWERPEMYDTEKTGANGPKVKRSTPSRDQSARGQGGGGGTWITKLTASEKKVRKRGQAYLVGRRKEGFQPKGRRPKGDKRSRKVQKEGKGKVKLKKRKMGREKKVERYANSKMKEYWTRGGVINARGCKNSWKGKTKTATVVHRTSNR